MMGWLANCVLLFGMWGLGEKDRRSFQYLALGELLWAVRGWQTSQWDLMLIGIVFGAVAIRNWRKWEASPRSDVPALERSETLS